VGVLEGVEAVPTLQQEQRWERLDELLVPVDPRTLGMLEHREQSVRGSRAWLIRRALVTADLFGVTASFLAASLAVGAIPGNIRPSQVAVFLVTLPAWVVLAKIHGLYGRDEQRVDQSTVEDAAGVFHWITVGSWLYLLSCWAAGVPRLGVEGLIVFWALALALTTAGRALARASCRRRLAYLQNTVILGAGETGQIMGRKLVKHPEYGLNLVGFVDSSPHELREEVTRIPMLGSPNRLREMVTLLDIDRVIVAGDSGPEQEAREALRELHDLDVQVDVVPPLFDLVGPRAVVHTIEGLPVVGIPPAQISNVSLALKRGIDIVVAAAGLVLTAPLFAVIAWKIKRDSPGPVFFRQERLGMHMREFTLLKFRTMKVDTDHDRHREYIKSIMSAGAAPESNGMYKLDRSDAVTSFGRWLRKTSLDELPQLVNVLLGDMSLVGPRPCIPYEAEHFAPHQFARFNVPAGLTGLWQVTARANSTFGEALDMDIAYARGWSLGLDLKLLCRTPFAVLQQRKSTA
jgi:exopolysaccharide biosynthesis polyprenyl glycosylphosphotransferase